jgi:hypothetical protein
VRTPSKVTVLPPDLGSLARAHPPGEPGTLFAMGDNGGLGVAPDAGFALVFGRNEPEVHICVGADDRHVSRRQGVITQDHSRWVLDNVGRLPIRLPGSRLLVTGDRVELDVGYTPLFVVAPGRQHLLEVRVAAGPAHPTAPAHEAETRDRDTWDLTATERLVLTCLAQRYLRNEPHPQPLTWQQVAEELGRSWTWRRAAAIVGKVRKRLSPHVPRLLEEEVPPPVGNALNHNLIEELLVTSTLTHADLGLLG